MDDDDVYTFAELAMLGVPLDLVPADAILCDRPRCCRLAGRLLPAIALCEEHYDACHDGHTWEIPGAWLADVPLARGVEYESRLAERCELRGVRRCAELDADLEERIGEAVEDLIVSAGAAP